MSSATSIEELPPKGGSRKTVDRGSHKSVDRGTDKNAGGAYGTTETPARETADQSFRPWHFFVLASLAASTVAVILSRQSAPEHLILISLTIGAAGAAAAAVYRTIVPLTVRDTSSLGQRPSDRARAALEREKTLVLRSIKELEFDRAMGKVSARDFEEMGGRLRARAMNLMKQLDEGGSTYRETIERELSQRLRRTGSPYSAAARTVRAASVSESTDRSCASCETVNDSDAMFCKRCGTALAGVQ